MARKKISKKIKQEIWAVLSIASGVLIFLALSGSLGVAGEWINLFSLRLFGLGVWIFPMVLISIGIALFLNSIIKFSKSSILGILLLFFSLQGLLQLSNLEISSFMHTSSQVADIERGGIFGISATLLFVMFFGTIGAKIIFTTLFIIAFLITFQLSLTGILATMWLGIIALFTPKPLTKAEIKAKEKEIKLQKKLQEQKKKLEIKEGLLNLEPQKNQEELLKKAEELQKSISENTQTEFQINRGKEAIADTEERENNKKALAGGVEVSEDGQAKQTCSRPENQNFSQWVPPLVDFLAKVSPAAHVSDKELHSIGSKIVEKLGHFKIGVEMQSAFVGPTVTQFALKPDETVKLSKITGLKNELALALSAENVRIEAPIVGKNLVGIEIPNRERSTVFMREIINSKNFEEAKGDLRLCLGKDVSGEAQIEALENMPHLLIAGATGSGKSVGMNSFIISMLYKNSPSDLRFIMVDPKRVELMPYEGIPHLLTPVITDDAKALSALRWSVAEMMRRLDDFSKVGARNIKEYNEIMLSRAAKQEAEKQEKIQKIETELKKSLEEKLKKEGLFEQDFNTKFQEEFGVIKENIEQEFRNKKQWKKIPKIVIIIDELADLMMREHKKETEAMICRIAQMARAVGMHLIIATQRPSVDVITGIIKANIPTRIAFSVTSSIDSRTVIDSIGAEDLLGKGDMLFTNASLSKPKRIQGIYISGSEIEKIVNHLKINISDEDFFSSCISLDDAPDSVDVPGFTPQSSSNQDERMEEALEVVRSTGKASASLLQRRLSVGYARAARILDEMEEAGAIGPSKGAKPRDIFL